jgi:hypothetical protein
VSLLAEPRTSAARSARRARRQDHEHVLAFEPRFAFDRRKRRHVLGHAIEQPASEARVRDLAPAKHDRYFDLASVEQQPFGHPRLRLVVVRLDLRTQLHFFEFEVALFLASVFVFFRLLVLEAPVVGDLADRRLRVGETSIRSSPATLRACERVFGRDEFRVGRRFRRSREPNGCESDR